MNSNSFGNNAKLLELVQLLDIPDSYYEKAVARYESLGRWLERPDSSLRAYAPKIFPQGSFRLGTVIRPLLQNEEYDLDLVCQLCLLKKSEISQRDLKEMVGNEVKAYAKANGIQAPVREGKRAWRLDYADGVSFHIDILASVPEDPGTIQSIAATGVPFHLAQHAIALTCTKDPNYGVIANRWPTSNPAGYGLRFEERMEAAALARRIALMEGGFFASIDEVPVYRLKTPLQRSIQLLKRHRDVMFRDNPKLKPISMIISTLSAHAYSGEGDLYESLMRILDGMLQFIRHQAPRVPNPTNWGEDFANKWAEDRRLEPNFRAWHDQASRDFRLILSERDPFKLRDLCERSFSLQLSSQSLKEMQGPGPNISPSSTGILTGAAAKPPLKLPRSSPAPWADS